MADRGLCIPKRSQASALPNVDRLFQAGLASCRSGKNQALSRPQPATEFTDENFLSPLIAMRDVQVIGIDKVNGILLKHLSQIAGFVKWQLHRPSRLGMSRCGRIPGNSLPPGSATLQLEFQLPVCFVIRGLRQ
jgi:hypothetical protein